MGVVERADLVDQGIGLDTVDWTTCDVLLNIGNLPDQHFAVFSGTREEKVVVISYGNSVYWILMLIKSSHKSSLELMLCSRKWLALASKIIVNFNGLNFIMINTCKVGKN